jgi:hypothetical protein
VPAEAVRLVRERNGKKLHWTRQWLVRSCEGILIRIASAPFPNSHRWVDSPATAEVVAVSGERYQIEVQVFWDASEKRTLRVLGSIDDGGWRALLPLRE